MKVVNPMRPSKATTREQCEELAERFFYEGFCLIARALNMTDDPKLWYTWDQGTRQRATELLQQLMATKARGTLSVRTAALAQNDAGLQRFIAGLATNNMNEE